MNAIAERFVRTGRVHPAGWLGWPAQPPALPSLRTYRQPLQAARFGEKGLRIAAVEAGFMEGAGEDAGGGRHPRRAVLGAMMCVLVPSRSATQIAPPPPGPWPKLPQYRWLAATATPNGPTWPVTMACALVPSRLAVQIVPFPLLTQ